MEKIVIFGATNHSHMLRKIIEKENNVEIIAYTVNKRFITSYEEMLAGCGKYPLIAFEEIDKSLDKSDYKILNTIGYTKMNKIRELKNKELVEKGYSLYTFISENAIVLSDVNGKGNIIMPGAYIGPNVKMGDGNVIYASTTLTHDIDIDNNTFIAAGTTVGGNVVIGNNCFLGLNSTIKNSVTIAPYTLVGAGSYIRKSTKNGAVYVPEKSIKLEKNSLDL